MTELFGSPLRERRETTPCVKLTIALFSRTAFVHLTMLPSIPARIHCSPASPLPFSCPPSPLLSVGVSFFSFARLRSTRSFQSFPLERRATLSHPFAFYFPLPLRHIHLPTSIVYPRRTTSAPPTVGTMRNAFL